VSNLANDSCSDCTSLNGTFVLQYQGSAYVGTVGNIDNHKCTWEYELTSSICGFAKIRMYIDQTTLSSWKVMLVDASGNETEWLTASMDEDVDGYTDCGKTYNASITSAGGCDPYSNNASATISPVTT
jgi:hypothetical protein